MKGARVRLTSTLRRFGRDQRAAVAIMFAVALVPLTVAVGATVDYTRASAAKEKLAIIADAAALEAISKAALEARRDLPDGGKALTEAFFKNAARSLPDVTLDSDQPKVTIAQTEASKNITIEYSATVKNYFGTFLERAATKVSGKAAAAASMTFIDFHLLLDNSPSMGLGATLEDIAKIEEATKDHPVREWRRCAFACHQAGQSDDHYARARRAGATLRIDVLRQATQNLIEKAKRTELLPDQFRVAIYTFNRTPQLISSLTADLDAAKRAADNIQLMTLAANNTTYTYTNFSGLIPYVDFVPNSGTGESRSSRKTIVFLVSDGVGNEATTPRIKPVPKELCNKIKGKNIRIAALYTTYYPLPGNHAYQTEVRPIADKIAPAMQECGSPGLYFEVSPTQGITEAMEKLFDKAVEQAHLTY